MQKNDPNIQDASNNPSEETMYTLKITTGWRQIIQFTDARLGHLINLADEFSSAVGYVICRDDRLVIEHVNAHNIK